MKKIWAYSIGTALSEEDLGKLIEESRQFVQSWTAHENKLQASVRVAENCVLLVEVDEAIYGASGCSIDKLQRFVQELEKKFQVPLLDRFRVPVSVAGKFKVLKSEEIKSGLEQGILTGETPVLNTSITNSEELLSWKQSLKNTWLKRYLGKESKL